MEVIKLTGNMFKKEVAESEKPVLIDFFAVWCGPCRMVSPTVDEIAAENDAIKVCKVDVDTEPELASLFGVVNIPTLVAVKGGKEAGRLVGVHEKSDILAMLG